MIGTTPLKKRGKMNKDMSYKICHMFKTIEMKYLPWANVKWLFVVKSSDWFDSFCPLFPGLPMAEVAPLVLWSVYRMSYASSEAPWLSVDLRTTGINVMFLSGHLLWHCIVAVSYQRGQSHPFPVNCLSRRGWFSCGFLWELSLHLSLRGGRT